MSFVKGAVVNIELELIGEPPVGTVYQRYVGLVTEPAVCNDAVRVAASPLLMRTVALWECALLLNSVSNRAVIIICILIITVL